MEKTSAFLRKYNAPDYEMLQYARVIHSFYLEDLADFAAFDPDFNADYGNDFLDAIKSAETFGSYRQMQCILATATVDVASKMRDCRDCFQSMKYFIEKAFPENPAVWSEFGYAKFGACRTKHPEMIQFMLELYETAVKYAAELDGVNFSAAQVTGIKSLADELQAVKSAQEAISRERGTKSFERINKLNICWNYCRTIRKASKTVYANNWGKWQKYLVPWSPAAKAIAEKQEEPAQG